MAIITRNNAIISRGGKVVNTDRVFVSLNQSFRRWTGIAVAPNGDVYANVYGGDIYKRTLGTTTFTGLGQTNRNWYGITVAPNGDVYAVGGDIYKQTGGVGNFEPLNQPNSFYRGIKASPTGDIYACTTVVWYGGGDGKIYKQTGGSGSFVAMGSPSPVPIKGWRDIQFCRNGDVYATANEISGNDRDYIYKQTGGVGNFVSLGGTPMYYGGLTSTYNDNLYVIKSISYGATSLITQKDYMGSFNNVFVSTTNYAFQFIASDINGDLYLTYCGTSFNPSGSPGNIFYSKG